jgi:hypothetical protein
MNLLSPCWYNAVAIGDDAKKQQQRRRWRHIATRTNVLSPTNVSMAAFLLFAVLSCSMLEQSLAFTFRSKRSSRHASSSSSRLPYIDRTKTEAAGLPYYQYCYSSTRRNMVRNIDLVECLIFYGQDSILLLQEHDGDDSKLPLLPGVESLVDECQRDGTAVIALIEQVDGGDDHQSLTENSSNVLTSAQRYLTKSCPSIHTYCMTRPAPNPKDIWTAIHSIPPIQPKGFGGSSGFGSKAADPERAPIPKHSVVLCSTENQCRAARYAGMRVLCLTDNALADAVLDDDWSTLYMDDIATPGSFWLNPPHPRDDESNGVDVESVIQAYEQRFEDGGAESQAEMSLSASEIIPDDDQFSDAELAKLLADIDPL